MKEAHPFNFACLLTSTTNMVQADMSTWNWLISIVFKRTTELQVLSMVQTSLKRVREREKEKKIEKKKQ